MKYTEYELKWAIEQAYKTANKERPDSQHKIFYNISDETKRIVEHLKYIKGLKGD